MAQANSADFLIIGAGIIGMTLALELKRRHRDASITVLEKETQLGFHASGRNSGVLHAGFYYTANSLKARFTRDGNHRLTQYCLERGLPINRCGKLVVARNEQELLGLDELHRRGRINEVELEMISLAAAREIEPRVKTLDRALWSPTTASVDPHVVLESLATDARNAGIDIQTGVGYQARVGKAVMTSAGRIAAGYVINSAGLHADRIARDFGFSQRYRIVPFKGLYLYSSEPVGALRTNVYPVPDLHHPFLGVHFTITADGHIKIGPTAIPAFWREHYRGIERFSLRDCIEVMGLETMLLFSSGFGFGRLALHEMQKYLKSRMVGFASSLVEGVNIAQYRQWGKPGIRAQLVDMQQRTLEMDFRFEGDDKSFHVLNAVSPAFTCSMAFSEFLVDEIGGLVSGGRAMSNLHHESIAS
jgi:L-2-hydroxyglutarate oxidase LhgO